MVRMILNDVVCSTTLPVGTPLIDFIRDHKKLVGTKIGCREGDCGACTVLVGEVVDGKMKYKTAASCVTPLGNADGKHIVTIEGLNLADLTPIQMAFVHEDGTQCGFCTPGFVVSLVGMALGCQEITQDNAISAIAGNICRCTGYKSIERAAKIIVDDLQKMNLNNRIDWLIKNSYLPSYFATITEKMNEVSSAQGIDLSHGKIIAGGTDLLVQEEDETIDSALITILDNSKLKGVTQKGDKIHIGAATTVSGLMDSELFMKNIPQMEDYLKLISSTQIRNMATVGGNIANASPIGDLSIMFQALGATVVLSKDGKKRECALRDFFTGYKKTAMTQGELIEEIYFNALEKDSLFSFEKIGKRIYLDMATVNSAMKLTMKNGLIENATFSVGGLGATIRHMEKTCDFLVGKKIDNQTFKEANKIAQSEITPRSRAEYKRLLVRQQLLVHMMKFSPSTVDLGALK